MLDRFKELLAKKKVKDMPRHIAITTNGKVSWANQNNMSIAQAYQKCFPMIFDALSILVKLDIPIITIYLLPYMEENKQLPEVIDTLTPFFNELISNELIHKNKVRISIWGKWYELPDKVIEPVKRVIESTKDYDSFFLNLCINYSGREEIIDVCKLIARKIKAGKFEPESIDEELFKDDLYSSSFLPPELIIKNGTKRIPNLLLWDSANSKIFFTGKSFLEFGKDDISKALEFFKSEG